MKQRPYHRHVAVLCALAGAVIALQSPSAQAQSAISWEKNLVTQGLPGAAGMATGTIAPRHITDIDADGYRDIVVSAKEPSHRVVWYRNPGPVGVVPYWEEYTIDAHSGGVEPGDGAMTEVDLGDIDGDGDPDVACALGDTDLIVWYQRPPDPMAVRSWRRLAIGVTKGPQSVVLGDVDGDGDLDAIAAGGTENALVWFENPAEPQLVDRLWNRHVVDDHLAGPRDVVTVHMNGDSFLDIVATGKEADTVAWYRNPGPISPAIRWPKFLIDAPSPGQPGVNRGLPGADSVWAGDLTGDGRPEVVATGERADSVVWYKAPHDVGEEIALWEKHVIDDRLDGARGLAVGDIENDGDSDVIAAGRAGGLIICYRNPGISPGTTPWLRHMVDADAADPVGVALGHINGDGLLDVTATSCRPGVVSWYRNPFGVQPLGFIRGDAHADLLPLKPDVTDLKDITAYLNKVTGHGVNHFDAADVNDDGFLTFEDVIRLGRWLYVDPTPLPAPFPGPGLDPTPDTITRTTVEPPPNVPPNPGYKVMLYWATPPNPRPGALAILRMRLLYPVGVHTGMVPRATQAHAAITFNTKALRFVEARPLLEGWDQLLVDFTHNVSEPSALSGALGLTLYYNDVIQKPRPIPPDRDLVEIRFVGRPSPVIPAKQVDLAYTVGKKDPAWLFYYTGIGYVTTNLSYDPPLTDVRFEVTLRETGSRFVRGDANSDGGTDISDAITILSYLFSGGTRPPCMDAADGNDDGTVDLGDPIYLLSFLFSGGPQPPDPFGHVPAACGLDPTHDELSCERYGPCYDPIDG